MKARLKFFKRSRLENYPNYLFVHVCVRKNPNSFHKCVFGWFELGLKIVLIWFCFNLEIVK